MTEIAVLRVGYLQTNCYVLTDGQFGVVVDPGGGYEKITALLKSKGVKADAVMLTHGHFDHILALPQFKKAGAKIYIHADDEKMLHNEWNLATDMGLPPIEEVQADVILHGGEKFSVGEMNFEVIHTPGHTQGSCCYDVDGKYLLSGDTLFCNSYGRTDFPGGSIGSLQASIKKLFEIKGDRIVYPGHDQSTTLSYEREYNPVAVYL